jgi:Trk K+ transport system NAD-binding subunit
LLIGNAQQPELLAEAGLATARAVVAATDNDLVNLEAALNARARRPNLRVVVRVFDPDFAVRVQRGFKIRFTLSVSHLVAPAFAAAAMGSEVVASVPVGDRRVIALARVGVPPGSLLDGRTIGSIECAGERRILGTVGPGDSTTRWGGSADERLPADSTVLVAATRAGLAAVLELTRPAPPTPPPAATLATPEGPAARPSPAGVASG